MGKDNLLVAIYPCLFDLANLDFCQRLSVESAEHVPGN